MISTEVMGAWQALDAAGMLASIMKAPARAKAHFQKGLDAPYSGHPDFQHVLVCGMGGSGSTGDFLQASCPEARVPITVHKNPMLPRWVNETTLVICVTYSGNTAETLGCLEQALSQGAQVHVLTSGGKALAKAEQEQLSHIKVDGGLPPRAALFDMLFALLGSLAELEVLAIDKQAVAAAADHLQQLAQQWQLTAENAYPMTLAQQLQDHRAHFWGRCGGADTVAMRWKNQLAENAKMLSSWSALPELNHNEIVPFCHQRFPQTALVYLRLEHSPFDQISLEQVGEYVGQTLTVEAEGATPLSRLLYLVYLADFVSVYLAYLQDVDPTPIQAIDTLKQRMAEVKV